MISDETTREFEAELRRAQELIRKETERAGEEAERAREEAERIREAGGIPPPAPRPALPGKELPPGFKKYEYPNAVVATAINVIGNEVVKMTTDDRVEEVVEFYRKVAGQPVIEAKDSEGEKAIFQDSGPPSLVITVGRDQDHPEKTQILVLRSSFKIPKLN